LNGLLLVDKPIGPTSHDVVARVRRAVGERRIGHTGTLDPAASGLLPLVVGAATRLARFLSDAGKQYEVEIRLGIATDTGDAEGLPIGPAYGGPWPGRGTLERALDAYRGRFLQQPPAFSAKKLGGRRSYDAARAARRAGAPTADLPPPVPVAVERLEVVDAAGDRVIVRVDCSAGFYVRALAHDLGRDLGVGAHVVRLRRTRSGPWAIADALPLERVETDPDAARTALIPPVRAIGHLPAVALSRAGLRRMSHGQDLGPADAVPGAAWPMAEAVRLLSAEGDLVGVAEPAGVPGLLHPSVVLG
jgi:tRNA pseudouridine55 synthase